MDREKLVDRIFFEVRKELNSAMDKFPPMNSAHEGCAVIREEFEELWDEVKKSPGSVSEVGQWREAIQVAAMAIRFLHDIRPNLFKHAGEE